MAETSPSHIRGKLVVLGSLSVTAGFCLANWINYALFNDNGPFQWRFPLAFQLVFTIIALIFLPLSVESPRWCLLRGRVQEARVVLARLRGAGCDLDDIYVDYDLRSIQKTLEDEQSACLSTVDTLLCRDPSQSLRRLLLRQVFPKLSMGCTWRANVLKLWDAAHAAV